MGQWEAHVLQHQEEWPTPLAWTQSLCTWHFPQHEDAFVPLPEAVLPYEGLAVRGYTYLHWALFYHCLLYTSDAADEL